MRASKFYTILFLLLTLPIFSCGKVSEKISNSGTEDKTKEVYNSPTVPLDEFGKNTNKTSTSLQDKSGEIKQVSDVPDITNRMIIKTGTVNLETEKYDEALNQITDYIKRAGGFITNSNSSVNASGKKQGSMTIRIQSDKYDQMVKDMGNFGKILNSQISGNDVTSEYIDLQARLTTQGELEKRLLNVLNEKTARLTDVVEVEQKLSNVREQIEKIQGRMKFLKNQTDYSTLTISIYEPSLMTTSSGGGFFYEIGNGFKKGLKGFTEILSGIITVTIALLPIIIILGIIAYIVVMLYKKSRAKKLVTTP